MANFASHLGNLTLEQQSKLDKLREEVHNAGYINRTEDSTLVATQRAMTKNSSDSCELDDLMSVKRTICFSIVRDGEQSSVWTHLSAPFISTNARELINIILNTTTKLIR